MRRKTNLLNRILSFVLCTVVILSSLNLSLVFTALGGERQTRTISEAEIVAGNYSDLSQTETDMLTSGLFAGASHTYPVPNDEDGLIELQPEEKKITASEFSKDGYVWKPVSAKVTYENGSEDVVLDNGTGTFTYSGKSYTVNVVYELYITVGESVQQKLINGPYRIIKGVDNIDAFYYNDSTIVTVGENISGLKKMADGYTLSSGMSIKLSNQDTIDAINRLYAQVIANGGSYAAGGSLNLALMLGEYQAAESVTQYLMTKGSAFKEEAIATQADFATIANDKGVATLISAIRKSDPQTYSKANAVLNAMSALVDETEDAVNDDWAILVPANNPLKSGMTKNDYLALDDIVYSVSEDIEPYDGEIRESLLADSVTVSYNLNRHNVTVVLAASVISDSTIDSTALTALDEYSSVISMTDGAAKAEVLAAIEESGFENSALTAWGVIDPVNYDRTASELPDIIEDDIEYRIAYTPKQLTLNYGFDAGLPVGVPYGYNMTLPANPDAEKVFDYFINGELYLQNTVYKVTSASSITRTEGKAWDILTFNKLAERIYSDDLTDNEKAALDSAALKGGYLRLRYPDNKDGLVTVEITGGSGGTDSYKVTAADFESGIDGYTWKAVSGKAVTSSNGVIAEFSFTNSVAEFTSTPFESIDVDYRLVLDGAVSDEQMLDALNLPGVLAAEAKIQKENLEKLNSQYENLGDLDKSMLTKINVVVKGSDMTDEGKAAFQRIYTSCVPENGTHLYLYDYLTQYRQEGLAYYYRDGNYNRIKGQINVFKENLSIVCSDPGFYSLLVDLGEEDNYQYIENILNEIDAIVLTDPNEAIDTTSPVLSELVAAIEAIDEPQTFSVTDKQLKLIQTLTVGAPDRAIISVIVEEHGSTGTVKKSGSDFTAVSTAEPLTDADIADINGKINALIQSVGIDEQHYSTGSALGLSAGETVTANIIIKIVYVPNEYTATVKDENGQTVGELNFSFDTPEIKLPACAEKDIQYRYTVCGEKIIVGTEPKTVRFTTEQIDGGEYSEITRETASVFREYTLNLIEQFNKAMYGAGLSDEGKLTAAFIPMEDADGELTAVLRLAPDLEIIETAFAKITEETVGSDFSYVRLGDDYLREDDTISLQALFNFIMNSGFGIDTLIGVITENGDINEMTLNGVAVIGADENGDIILPGGGRVAETGVLGGKIMETTMNFKTGKDEAGTDLKLYITLEDFDKDTDKLMDLRKSADDTRANGNFSMHDGIIDFETTLPEEVYQDYLTVMVALDNTSLKDIDNIDRQSSKDLVLEILSFIFGDATITETTFKNTDKKLGRSNGLMILGSSYDSLRDILNGLVNNSTFNNENITENVYESDVLYDINPLLDSFGIADALRGIIKENGSGIEFGIKVKTNNRADYEAMIIDAQADGSGKFVYTRDLTAALNNINNNSIIMLLQDHTGDLTTDKELYIDLNGYKIIGDLMCSAKTMIFDSSIETASGAGVTGTVSGEAVITAGTYASDVTDMLKDGYILENGTVRNVKYYITTDNDNINIHLTPGDEEIFGTENNEDDDTVAVELGLEIILNYYMCAALNINGNSIYSFEIEDVIRLLDQIDEKAANDILRCFDRTGLTSFANDLLEKLNDFSALGKAVKDSAAAITYNIEYRAWDFDLVHIVYGDYLTANLHPADTAKTRTLNIYIDQSADYGDMLEDLSKILKANTKVKFSEIYYDYIKDRVIVRESKSIDHTIDLTEDPNYAIVTGIVLANSTDDQAKRTALVNGIKIWYQTGYKMADLKAAIENMTTAELVDAFSANKTFENMLSDLGLSSTVSAELTEFYNKHRLAIKSAFEIIDRAGSFGEGETKLSRLNNGKYGIYTLVKENTTAERNFSFNEIYGLTVETSLTKTSLTVKLFNEDAQYSVVVLDGNGKEIWHGNSLNSAFEYAKEGYTVSVKGKTELKADITVDRNVTVKGYSNIEFESYKIKLSGENTQLRSDGQIKNYIVSTDDTYYVNAAESSGVYTYNLKHYKTVVKNGDERLYAGDDINKAFANATDGSVITVYDSVKMTASYKLTGKLTIANTGKIDFNGNKIRLNDEVSELRTDKDIQANTEPADETYKVVKTGSYVYKAVRYSAVVTRNGSVIHKSDDINSAINNAANGSVIRIYKAVKVKANIELDRVVTIVGAANINFGAYRIKLTNASAKLTSDVRLTNVDPANNTYKVTETSASGGYVYTTEHYNVVVKNGSDLIYTGSDINKAMKTVTDGSIVMVYSDAALSADASISCGIEIKKAANIFFGKYKIRLVGETAKIKSDANISDYVVSADKTFLVQQTEAYVYTLIHYDIVVTKSGAVLYAGKDLNEAFAKSADGSTLTVYGKATLTADVVLDRGIKIEGSANIDFNGKKIRFANVKAKLTVDANIAVRLTSSDALYRLQMTGSYVYTLVHQEIAVVKDGKVIYAGSDLEKAFEKAADGSKITVYEETAITADVKLDREIFLVGAGNIDFGGSKIILNKNAKLTSDAKLSSFILSGSDYAKIKETGSYVYTVEALAPTISDPVIKDKDDSVKNIIKGYKINNTEKTITLDILDRDSENNVRLAGNGITAKELIEALDYKTINAETSKASVIVKNKKLSDDALVPTDAVISISIFNSASDVIATVNYTVIVLGDTNCNGRIDSGDAKKMLDHYFGTAILKGNQLLAADTNGNGRIESGDAVKNSVKYNRPADYKYDLK